ncbi:Serine/threonine-protein phosphatase 2A activator [Tetrabaena socialis]|uniref:Serine/threonine-protein phosphatase 2A activator n=1 Tax=Tetrabaena socialis TaxID=47790 RepID=A0A2J7ZSZ5_9CHLO|nr:Serine/threonine-protein phosphatase 2A activator [Tetrabaena socialis]|eukprot:PNH03394.1 Serine/threonine-protein phosphatase 2A activator [Tetrabaena socialis]
MQQPGLHRPEGGAPGGGGPLPPDDSPGVPTSAPYHSKDTLSPTAAPWAALQPHPPPASASTSDPPSFSLPRPGPAAGSGGGLGSGGLGGGGLGGFAGFPALAPSDGTFSLPAGGGAGGGYPSAAAAAAAVAASHANMAARRPPEAIITVSPAMPAPAPPAPQYQPARKRILSADDLKRFLAGESVKGFMAFILSVNEAVAGKKAVGDASYSPSPAVQALCGVLTRLCALVDEVPPEEQSLRYGNPAFRTWCSRLAELAPGLLGSVLPDAVRQASVELVPYLLDSFGNSTRIDYGTGHETTFVALLYCLAKLGVFGEEDRQGLGLVVFKQYLELMRKIQTTYWLEPAGSHGVWGLDDYQFLPFIWGSAQLINHPMIKPRSIHNPDILEAYADAYLYLGCIKFVKQVKKGLLGETSPMLNDISSVPSWAKVNSGMIKMYQVEVLSKFPIMQHFIFGSLLTLE